LTGANADGAEGLRRIVARGGMAIVQEPVTAESPTMPTAALRAVPAARVMTVAAIGALIGELGRDHSTVNQPSTRDTQPGRPEARA
jgi:two-component system chemotaxis response regulator CheB